VVITIDPFPEEIVGEDWLVRGARGQFNGHARRLARNLVRARMGAATIRLAHEANGSWTPYRLDLRERRGQLRRWGRFWRTMVKAMRSVKGARFRFDWCINAHYRAIPLRYWYPGDDVVDVIGVDAYDSGVRAGVPRWKTIYDQRLGVRDVVRFARRHRKPMSFPEWGVAPAGTPGLLAGGDNAAYVEGIARVVRRERVSYQAYFFTREWRRQLITGPRSLRALRRALR
jgi:hypothetical protein